MLDLDAAHATTLLMSLAALIEQGEQQGHNMSEELAVANAILCILGHEDPELFTLVNLHGGEFENN